jgi:hypothetical protein
MRATSAGLVVFVVVVLVTTASSRSQQPPAREGAELGQVLSPHVPFSLEDETEIAGLGRGSKPELLTWEKVYALAVIRARVDRGPLLEAVDAAALKGESERLGVADFARFRKDFVTSGGFRDPGPSMFALLGRLQAIKNARAQFTLLESLARLLQERIQGESSGLSRLDIDTVLAAQVKASRRLDHRKRLFRDGLDELKVAIGLSPRAAVILDRETLAAFQDVFESVAKWEREPGRNLASLPELIGQLPELGDVVVLGQPLLSAIDLNPDQWEDVLTKAARLALEKRGEQAPAAADPGARAGLELQTRRRVRHLVELRRAYEDAKRAYGLAIRIKDQSFERLISPPSDGGFPRSSMLERVIEQVANFTSVEDQLAELWTTFRAERLVLYRELAALPYGDWKSFHADLAARPAGEHGK